MKRGETEQLRRELGFADIYFMSIGGQSPLLSLLTYATTVVSLSSFFSPIAVLLGTVIVLLNGLSVYYLSNRFPKVGGYYTYAFYSLSKRLGLETGWVYLMYSIFYGAAYIAGSTYVLSIALNIPSYYSVAVVLIPSVIFLISGIKPSTKYAIFAASLELAILVFLSIYTIYLAKFNFYNPLSKIPPLSQVIIAVLFGVGIPTGYGSITPISGEVKKAKTNIGRAAISVIITGGLLTSLIVYGMLDAARYTGASYLLSTNLPLLKLTHDFLGPYAVFLLLFAAINDGILASLSFMTAASRTIFAMATHGFMPRVFSKIEGNRPLNAVLFTSVVFAFISLTLIKFQPYTEFYVLGAVAGLANLFVHLAANFSLIRISVRRWLKGRHLAHLPVFVGLTSVLFSSIELIYSIIYSNPYLSYAFFSWIIIGFLYAEVLDMKHEEEED